MKLADNSRGRWVNPEFAIKHYEAIAGGTAIIFTDQAAASLRGFRI